MPFSARSMFHRPDGIPNHEFLPGEWVRNCVERDKFAGHIRRLKERYGNGMAKHCIRYALYVGCLPVNRNRLANAGK